MTRQRKALYRKAPYNKPPTTYTAQVAQLQDRGLSIDNSAQAEFYLSQLNYYRLAALSSPARRHYQLPTANFQLYWVNVLHLILWLLSVQSIE